MRKVLLIGSPNSGKTLLFNRLTGLQQKVANFPGVTGLQLALWKGAVDWGTGHGDGSGDPTQGFLGDGGADFEPAWMGRSTSIGNTVDNVVSAISSCDGGTLAFAEVAFEIGWRLARPYWGQGYAAEAARAWLQIGFERHGLDEIVSFTATINEPSRRVMERIGMARDPSDDFPHPMVPATSPLRTHVLYKIRRPARPA